MSTEIKLHCWISYATGERFHDVRVIPNIHFTTFYEALHTVSKAIKKCSFLELKFPQTPAECEEAANDFMSCSRGGAICQCVGFIDGYLAEVKQVTSSDHCNPRAFYSGHYNCPGLNVQAVCDSKCRFTYFSVAAVGSTPDCVAFEKTDLPELLENLPYAYYLFGDCAYVCTNQLLVPFSGSQRMNPANDSFNFHLSQLRIKIEQAFGVSLH